MPRKKALTGIVRGLDEKVYHAHDSLSSTGAKLLAKSAADFKWNKDHPQPFKKVFDEGTIAHALVLGTPIEVAVVPNDILTSNGALSTKAAKEFVENARLEGKIPMKADEHERVVAVAEAVLAHPVGRALFESEGDSELSMFATDPDYGFESRCRFDRIGGSGLVTTGSSATAIDLKTTAKGNASRREVERTIANLGYGISHEHYRDVARWCGVDIDRFLFLFVEKDGPYHITVWQFDEQIREKARTKLDTARRRYAHGLATGEWPGYAPGIQTATIAPFQVYEEMDDAA